MQAFRQDRAVNFTNEFVLNELVIERIDNWVCWATEVLRNGGLPGAGQPDYYYSPPLNKCQVGLVKYRKWGVILEYSGQFIGCNIGYDTLPKQS